MPTASATTTVEVPTIKYVISDARKEPAKRQYGSHDVFLSGEVLVPQSAPIEEHEQAIDKLWTFLQFKTAQRVGLTPSVDTDTGLVVVLEDAAVPEVAPAQRKTSAPPAQGGEQPKRDAADLWAELSNEPGKWFDNRDNKRNPAAPDFRRKGTGEGLWLVGKDGKPAHPDWFDPDNLGAF